MELKFSKQILEGRLKIINAFACDEALEKNQQINFYQSRARPGESTFIKKGDQNEWIDHMIPTISASKLILSNVSAEYTLLYVKIDVEGADGLIINDLMAWNLVPNYLSVEIHDIAVVHKVLDWDVFNSIQITEAGHPNVGWFGRLCINLVKSFNPKMHTKRIWVFSEISSGPFGIDLPRKWIPVDRTLDVCKWFGLGARDLHFAIKSPKKARKSIPFTYAQRRLKNRFKVYLNVLRKMIAKLLKFMLSQRTYDVWRRRIFGLP
jgi:hypothetical protein